MKNSQKYPKPEKVPFVLGKRFRSSDIACWNKWERLFSNLRLLLGKRNIARILRQNSDSIGKFSGCILTKLNIRRKMRILKHSHSTEKNRKGDPLVLSSFVSYVQKVKNESGTLSNKLRCISQVLV